MEFFRGVQWDIIGRTKLWFIISAVTIVAGMAAWGIRGLNYGIDFTGGSLLRFAFAMPLAESDDQVTPALEKARGVLAELGLSNSEVQVVSDQQGRLTSLYLRTPPVANDEEASARSVKVLDGLKRAFPDKGDISDLGRESVGPVVGAELRNKAILALVLGSLLIGVYVSVRYQFRFAVAGVLALLHDALVATGAVALFHVELNSSFVAAILTILGFSMHDTVVIFDRIRENMKLHRGRTFAETVNWSLLQTMARSVNTVITVLMSALALLILGGPPLHAFSLALLFGITTGCYSSIFFAPPLVVLWEGKAARERTAGRASVAKAPAAPARRPRSADVPAAGEDAARRAPRTAPVQSAGGAAVDPEEERLREERREKRLREKERQAKKGGKSKKRF